MKKPLQPKLGTGNGNSSVKGRRGTRGARGPEKGVGWKLILEKSGAGEGGRED